jgi:hypothetical protein
MRSASIIPKTWIKFVIVRRIDESVLMRTHVDGVLRSTSKITAPPVMMEVVFAGRFPGKTFHRIYFYTLGKDKEVRIDPEDCGTRNLTGLSEIILIRRTIPLCEIRCLVRIAVRFVFIYSGQEGFTFGKLYILCDIAYYSL